jgi:hypothetical protein
MTRPKAAGPRAAGPTAARPRAARPGAAKPVVVHDLAQATAVIAAARKTGTPVALWSAPAAAARSGVGWFAALSRLAAPAEARGRAGLLRTSFVLDCGARADLAQEAFREGLRDICFTGRADVAARLADIARKWRGRLHRRRPRALDLAHAPLPDAPLPGAPSALSRLQQYLADD